LRISRFVFAVAFAGLGVWALVKGDNSMGVIYIAISAAWLLMGIFSERLAAMRGRHRAGPQ
jgi:hypothetical protein